MLPDICRRWFSCDSSARRASEASRRSTVFAERPTRHTLVLGTSGTYHQANFLRLESDRLDRMPLAERPLAVPQRKVRDSRTSLANEAEGSLRISQCAPQTMNQFCCSCISDSHECRAVATETCHRIEHHVERGKAKRFLRPKQGFLHRIPQTARRTAQRDAHMQHPGRTRSDAAGRCRLAAQPQLSFNDFRKFFRIRIQGEEARNECGNAGNADLAWLQRIGKEIVHCAHMFFRLIPILSQFVAVVEAPLVHQRARTFGRRPWRFRPDRSPPAL